MANENQSGRAIQNRTLMLTQMGVLTAIVVALQVLAIVLRPLFPVFTISLVLIPIAIGAALHGAKAGAWLGLTFGVAVLVSGDAALFMAFSIPGTLATVLVKGMLAGLAAGLVYRLVAGLGNKTLAATLAGIVCPIVNTGVFVIGSYVFFMPLISEWAGETNTTEFIFLGLIGVNFFVEVAINLVLTPVVVRILQLKSEKKI